MNGALPNTPGFWRTVRLLLGAARRRASGRRKRQRELLNNRAGRGSVDWSGLGFVITILVMISVNGCAAFVVRSAVASGERIEFERQGKIVVSRSFFESVRTTDNITPPAVTISDKMLTPEKKAAVEAAVDASIASALRDASLPYSGEAKDIAEKHGGSRKVIEQKLRDAVHRGGSRDLIPQSGPSFELAGLPQAGAFPAMWGSIILIWWAVMLIFQGEGLELDLQRRRHPMWEWLFSHPVPPGAVFLAEMISPMAANPIYWGVPLFVGILYGSVYDPMLGLLAAVLIGVPIAVAAACLGKALEIGAILRLSPRSRGAMIGFMSWLGYASMMLCFLGAFFVPKVIGTAGRVFDRFSSLPWPWLKLFLGGQAGGSFSFPAGMLTCWAFAGVTVAGSIGISVWGAQKGLSGNTSRVDPGPSVLRRAGPGFGKDPLYRKEFLWFIRDRSAIVQAILIPMTVAGFQLFNLRSFVSNALEAWNYLCGAGLLFGTYFLWVLGPRSLASEGNALWIALTWPRGLESLLKAKAWLWSLIATGMVSIVLCYAAYLFPGDIPGIALVGIGWFFFGRSMAEKTVTLVSVPLSSGEKEKVPMGRQWAAQLGMLTFSIGVFTRQWPTAVIGIVYSYMTAAAMWQNFRARLPYLYDPWSEKLPPPPTLMHAMIAISIMVEAGAVITGILVVAAGREGIAVAQAIGYAICAVAVSIGTANFLSDRGVSLRDVLNWPPDAFTGSMAWRYSAFRKSPLPLSLLTGALGGLALGLLGLGYVAALQHIPAAAEILRKSQEEMAKMVGLRTSYAVMAVGFAPFAEEYLFRGLLFRALDREWGSWRAVIGSAAFFAIYHAPLFWLPVVCVGMVNALLFKKSGRLAPAVVLHMVYNAVVVWAM